MSGKRILARLVFECIIRLYGPSGRTALVKWSGRGRQDGIADAWLTDLNDVFVEATNQCLPLGTSSSASVTPSTL